jgi:hypothetical protein
MRLELTQEIIKELLHYDPDTGDFTWKERDLKWCSCLGEWKRWNTRFAKTRAGGIFKDRSGKMYRYIGVFSKPYFAHRLAHLYMTGVAPVEVDHENGNGLDNRWINIQRSVTRQENGKNLRKLSSNTSGIAGVSWHSKAGKWQVSICADGKYKYLGLFSNIKEAATARKNAEIRYGYHQNHGSERPL